MNSILTCDKLILYYLITEKDITFNENYFYKYYYHNDIYFNLGNDFRAYENKSQNEMEVTSKYNMSLEYKGEKIGTLYIDNPDKKAFHFKYRKELFYNGKYTILEIKNLIDTLFKFTYSYIHITRLELALDTNGTIGKELNIITDLCSRNMYFRSIKNNDKDDDIIVKNHKGRKYKDAKYGATKGNLTIYHHTRFPNSTCIGHYKSPIFIRCYDKKKKCEPYQYSYFKRYFNPNDKIYRLEVSVNSEGSKRHSLDISKLDIKYYLIQKYKEMVGNRLTFNELKHSYIDKNKNTKYRQINLLEKIEFDNDLKFKDTLVSENYDSNTIPIKKIPSKIVQVNSSRSQVSKRIGEFLRNEDVEDSLNFIENKMLTDTLDYNNNIPDIDYNISQAKKLIRNQLTKNDFKNGIERAEILKNFLENLTSDKITEDKIAEIFENFLDNLASDKITEDKKIEFSVKRPRGLITELYIIPKNNWMYGIRFIKKHKI